jgi:hypothetical protein
MSSSPDTNMIPAIVTIGPSFHFSVPPEKPPRFDQLEICLIDNAENLIIITDFFLMLKNYSLPFRAIPPQTVAFPPFFR